MAFVLQRSYILFKVPLQPPQVSKMLKYKLCFEHFLLMIDVLPLKIQNICLPKRKALDQQHIIRYSLNLYQSVWLKKYCIDRFLNFNVVGMLKRLMGSNGSRVWPQNQSKQ